jgi:hypothetical protein
MSQLADGLTLQLIGWRMYRVHLGAAIATNLGFCCEGRGNGLLATRTTARIGGRSLDRMTYVWFTDLLKQLLRE